MNPTKTGTELRKDTLPFNHGILRISYYNMSTRNSFASIWVHPRFLVGSVLINVLCFVLCSLLCLSTSCVFVLCSLLCLSTSCVFVLCSLLCLSTSCVFVLCSLLCLSTSCVFVSCSLLCLSTSCVFVYPMLSVFLDCPFAITLRFSLKFKYFPLPSSANMYFFSSLDNFISPLCKSQYFHFNL